MVYILDTRSRLHVSVHGQETKIHTLLEHDPVPLTIHHRPVCITFALFNLEGLGVKHAVDPTRKEAAASDGAVTIAVNANREICGMNKLGGSPISSEHVRWAALPASFFSV